MQREQISALRDGALAAASLLVGIVPWGIVAGVAMVSAGLSRAEAVGMSLLVFAGSAQLAVLPLLIAKAPLWVMYATALVVNLRYVIYSAVLAPYFEHLSRPWRALLMPLLFDRAVTWGAIAAGGVALVATKLPLNLGLLAAIAAGVAVGLAVARFGAPRAGRG
ncbi:MAG: AzlC family ABC transporter permease [Betaproteobacteria bacterium]|nr:MAG: AzlC family ABC transporter permease [Betaproteobacteria bacterium]